MRFLQNQKYKSSSCFIISAMSTQRSRDSTLACLAYRKEYANCTFSIQTFSHRLYVIFIPRCYFFTAQGRLTRYFFFDSVPFLFWQNDYFFLRCSIECRFCTNHDACDLIMLCLRFFRVRLVFSVWMLSFFVILTVFSRDNWLFSVFVLYSRFVVICKWHLVYDWRVNCY